MIRKLLLTLAISQILQSQCTDNCLRCVEKVCQYCDLSQGYRLVEGQCKIYQQENCYLFDDLGTCLICNEGFHIDSASQRCIKIMQEDLIENCGVYNSPNTCSFCKAGFFLNNGNCEQIQTPIANCEVENSQAVCLQCSPGYIISIDQKSCLADPKVTNCQTYKLIECDSCSSGFMKVPNFYLSQVFSFVSNSQKADFVLRQNQIKQGRVNLKGSNNCIKTNVTNCDSYYAFDFCDRCSTGFLRNEKGVCIPQPSDLIPNCNRYDSLTSCIQCKDGFWLQDALNCLPIKSVPFCKTYSQQLGQNNCIECLNTHFLIGFNNCVLRTMTVENCYTMNPVEESCSQCNNTFVLSDDRMKCLAQISNCIRYQVSSYLNDKLTCLRCGTGYYLKKETNFCNKGDIQNCLIYENESNVCLVCENKFFLNNGFCDKHDVIPNCQIYHQKLKNVCSDCNYESFKFESRTECINTTEVTNCAIYLTPTICAQCIDKYFLNPEGICELIPASENCVQRIGNQCHKCLSDFILENGICRDPLDYIQNECSSHNVDGTVDYERQKCFICGENRIPINYRDNHLCIEKDIMMYRQNSSALDANCLIYDQDPNNKYTCIRCVFPKVLHNGTCIDNCPNDRTLYKQILKYFNKDADRLNESFSVDNINVCGPLIPNCKVAAPDLYQPHQSKISYTCVQCNEGSIPIVEFDFRTILIQEPDNKDIQFGKSPVSFIPSKNCVAVAQQNILGEINVSTQLMDNCDLYINLGLTIGCTKCSHGFSGVVLDVVNQCEVYINNQYTCSKCKLGFYKASIYECRPVQTVDQCLYYSQTSNTTKCIECQAGYFVQSDTKCAQRTISIAVNCTPEKLSDTCKCIDGYFNVNVSGGFQCEPKPLNCITPINQQSCLLCDNTKSFRKSVIQNGTNIFICQAGGITNCIQYKAEEQVCLQCNETAYLKDGSCILHTALSRCTTRDGNLKNTCKQCQTGNVLFNFTSKCLQINKIDFCLEYDSIQTCLKCQDNYRLDNLRARCIKIPDEENCIVQVPLNILDNSDQTAGYIDIYDAKNLTDFIYTCNVCKSGYFRIEQTITFNTTSQVTINNVTQDHPQKNNTFTVHVCRNYINSFIDSNYCDEHNVTGTTLFTDRPYCASCKTNFFPEFIQDERYICMDKKYVESKSGVQLMTNCRRVAKINAGAYACDLCNDGYYLNAGDCVVTCPNQYKIQDLNDTAGKVDGFKTNNRSCVTQAAVTDCKVYASSFTRGDDKCVQCKDGFVPAYTQQASNLNLWTNYNPINNILETNNMVSQYRVIDGCYSSSNANAVITGSKGADGFITNCAKYFGPKNNKIFCMQCNIGYSGIAKADGDFNYIDSCQLITGCDTAHILNSLTTTEGRWVNDLGNLFYGFNAGFGIQELFSCFACTGNKTPVIHGKLDFTNGTPVVYQPYGIDTGNNTTLLNAAPTLTSEKVIECRQLYAAADGSVPQAAVANSFLADINVPGVTLFGNKKGCALAWADTNLALTVTNIKCVACKAGYKPYRATVPANNNSWATIDYCEAIEFCEDTDSTGKWLNGCYNCVHYYDYWTASNTIGRVVDFARCVAPRANITTTNCLAAYYSGPCQICKKGYVKNKDGICEQMTVAKCQTYNLFNNGIMDPSHTGIIYDATANTNMNNVTLQTFLFYQEFNKGCIACESNYMIFPVSNTNPDNSFIPYICSNNPFNTVKPVTGVSDTPNCANYGLIDPQLTGGYPATLSQVPSLLTCKKCQAAYVLTSDGKCTPRCPADFWVGGNCVNNAVSNLLDCDIANEMNGTTCMKCSAGKLNVAGVCVSYNNTTPIKNCAEYNMNDSFVLPYALCNKCSDGYYLSPDNRLCLSIPLENCATWGFDNTRGRTWCLSCMSNYLLIEKRNLEQYCFPLSLDAGAPDNQDQCEQWNQSLFVNRQLECNKCKLGTNHYFRIRDSVEIQNKTHCLPFQNNVTDCSSFDVNVVPGDVHPEAVTYPTALFGTFFSNSFNCLTCVQDNGTDPYKTYWYDQAFAVCKLRTQVANCKEHFIDKNECKICEDNFLLRENQCINLRVADNEQPLNRGYVQKCQKMDECDGKVSYQGLHPHLLGLVSCHACTNTSQIPFIGVRMQGDTFTSLQEYGVLASANMKFHQFSKNKATECLSPVNTTFGILPADWSFPTNCGVGVVNTNQTPSTLNPFYAVFCGACKPGFKATFVNKLTMQYNIQTCTAIQNCESSTWFNYCSQCLPKHTYQYIQKKGVQYDVCLNFEANPNCYAAEQVSENNVTTLKCKFCRVGYILNPDGYCENLLAPRCSQFKFNFRTNYDIEDLATGLIINGGGFGCQQCDDGFVGVYNREDQTNCTASPYHFDQKLIATSNYIFQCKRYRATPRGELWCYECYNDFTLTIRGKCVPNTDVPNCKLALDSKNCRECLPGFVVNGRKCEASTIQNCEIFGNNDQSFFQYCLKCKNGFYLQDNKCVAGTILNCDQYTDNNVCKQCQPNFALIFTQNMKNYCYPISSVYNCADVDQDAFKEGEFKCNQCSSNKYFLNLYKETFNFQNSCQRFLGIENCAEYDQERFFYESTFVCTKCQPLYFLDSSNTCTKRINTLEKCLTYISNADRCESCENGFFISIDGLQCVPFPTGIPKCGKYLTQDVCLECVSGFYLKSNICLPIDEAQKVDNCAKYYDNGFCAECATGFIWTQNKCAQVQAKNCATFENINTCATCLSGNGFKYSDDNKFLDCVAKTKPNCLVSEDWAPFKCVRCEKDFYVDATVEANCIAVPTPIPSCLEYVSDTICKTCAIGFALTADKKQCLKNVQITSILDPNCADSKITEQPNCQTCQWGHIFTYGFCKACKQNTLADGCMNCDPNDQSKCLLCLTGYYMAENGLCYKNGSKPDTPNPDNGGNNGGNNGGTTKGDFLRNVMMIALLLFGLF